jgi:transcriptional regulator with XRE-family HTH domain
MDARKVNQAGGKWLKALRERLGLSTRAVQGISKKIADDKQNQEFYLSHNWVTDIENGKFTPGMFKVYSLSTIYDRKYSEVASHFGLHIAEEDDPEKVSLPVEFKPGFRFEKTNLLARVIEKWDEVPVGLLQHLDLRKSVYGYVGLEDFTLFPIIRPGSLVQIDATQRKISSLKWKNEYERPVYFTELRDGYVCSWCEVDRGQLLVVPHPHARLQVRRFDYPSQAEIIGRVTGVTMRIVGEKTPERRDSSREK